MKHPFMHLLLMAACITFTAATTYARSTMFRAVSETNICAGSLNGTTCEKTRESDNAYQIITEAKNGWPFYQTFLKHTWQFDISPGDSATFYIEAHCDQREDGFHIYYYTDPDHIVLNRILTIDQKEDTLLSADLPADISGTVYITVEDTDKSWWHLYRDSVYIDDMYITCTYSSQADGAQAPISHGVTPLYPEDGSVSVYKRPTFVWEENETGDLYDLYLSRDENKIRDVALFTGDDARLFFDEEGEYYFESIAEPRFNFPDSLETGFWYYWRIASSDRNGTRHLSPVRKFYVPGLPAGFPGFPTA